MSGYVHVPANYNQSSYLNLDPDLEERSAANRRATLQSVLRYAQQNVIGAVGLVELAAVLGLDEELEELAGDGPAAGERHRRLAAARAELAPPAPASDGS
jgi:hypothetical protein